MMASPYRRRAGYSLLEMMMAMFAGSLLMAGAYQGFSVLSRQYDAVRSGSDINESGISITDFLAADIRAAGRLAYDGTGRAPGGAIDTPLIIEDDPNHACCSIVTVTYDTDTQTRAENRYYVADRGDTDERLGLYIDKVVIQDGVRTTEASKAFIADYVEAFRVETLTTNNAGQPLTAVIEVILRAKQRHMFPQSFTPPAYAMSVHDYTAPDNRFERRFFTKTVLLRNLEKF